MYQENFNVITSSVNIAILATMEIQTVELWKINDFNENLAALELLLNLKSSLHVKCFGYKLKSDIIFAMIVLMFELLLEAFVNYAAGHVFLWV